MQNTRSPEQLESYSNLHSCSLDRNSIAIVDEGWEIEGSSNESDIISSLTQNMMKLCATEEKIFYDDENFSACKIEKKCACHEICFSSDYMKPVRAAGLFLKRDCYSYFFGETKQNYNNRKKLNQHDTDFSYFPELTTSKVAHHECSGWCLEKDKPIDFVILQKTNRKDQSISPISVKSHGNIQNSQCYCNNNECDVVNRDHLNKKKKNTFESKHNTFIASLGNNHNLKLESSTIDMKRNLMAKTKGLKYVKMRSPSSTMRIYSGTNSNFSRRLDRPRDRARIRSNSLSPMRQRESPINKYTRAYTPVNNDNEKTTTMVRKSSALQEKIRRR